MRNFSLALFLLLAACSSAPSSPASNGAGQRARGDGQTDGGVASTGDIVVAADAAPAANADCSEAAKLVYVVTAENDLYSFKPAERVFTRIGRLTCDAGGEVPNSMAVSRDAVAWVNYGNGRLYRVSVQDASCTPTTFEPEQARFGRRFGMGFASDSAGSSAESLFITALEGRSAGLGKVDLGTLRVTAMGPYGSELDGEQAELTGTGDGKLYGFFMTEPSTTLATFNKVSGAVTNVVRLPNVEPGNAWAFSFWGGDFWFYTARSGGTSTVTRYEPATNTSTVALADVGFRIVGAGVSTCAPTSVVR